MSALDDIYFALMAGKHSNDALETWVRNSDGRDSVRQDANSIRSGLAALEKLRTELRAAAKIKRRLVRLYLAAYHAAKDAP